MEPRDALGVHTTFNVTPDTVMAPPHGEETSSTVGHPSPPQKFTEDVIMAPPHDTQAISKAGSSTQPTSLQDSLMVPSNGTYHSAQVGSSTSLVPLIDKACSTKHDRKGLFFPVLDQHNSSSSPLSGSSDLLSLFNVSSMYDRFVRPYLKATETTSSNHAGWSLNGDLKGKGKADVVMNGTGASESSTHKRMKMEKSYGHFVADVGGRNSIKKDHQLQTWIMDPNFQEASIPNFLKPFPPETLAKAFDLQPGVLPGVLMKCSQFLEIATQFDTSVWIAEEGGPKRKRKKRKQGDMVGNGESGAVLVEPMPATQPPPTRRSDNIGPGATLPAGSREEEHRKKKRTKLVSVAHPVAI